MKPVVELPKAKRPLRAIAFICSLLACSLIAKAQNDASEITRVIDEFISKVFTECKDGTYYFGPHEMNNLACTIPNSTNRVDTAREVSGCAELIEYKEFSLAQFVTVEHRGSASVRMQLSPKGSLEIAHPKSAEKRVLLLISYPSYRSQVRITSARLAYPDRRTQQFEAWGRPVLNLMPSLLVDVGDHGVEYRLPPGTVAFGVMTKANGQWTFAPGPDFPLQESLTQVSKRVGLDGGPVADAAGEVTRKLGPAFALNELLAGSHDIEKIASEKPTSCDALARDGWGVPRSIRVPQMVRPGTVVSPAAADMLNPPKFAGNADQFATAFPGLLQRAAVAAGLDAQAFGKESEFVINSIRTCAQITPAMAEETIRKDVPSSMRLVNIHSLGTRYDVCVQGGRTEPNAKFPDTSVAIQMRVDPDAWLMGKGFTALVFFLRPNGRNRSIILATIAGPSPAHVTR